MIKRFLLIFLLVLILPSVCFGVASFPGAEGYGAVTRGAYGQAPGTMPTIYRVTNTNNSGTGSFRDAVSGSNRIIIFDTGGTIQITSQITISASYLTIAGQTAPGGGIAIGGHTVEITGHDIILRGMRMRLGTTANGGDDMIRLNGNSTNVYNIIVDHCSITWADDENASHYKNVHDVTWQWNIIAKAMNWQATPHGMGLLIGTTASAGHGENISVHHNLFAAQRERQPCVQATSETEMINNIVYNWQNRAVQSDDTGGESLYMDMISNYFKIGPCQSSSWKPLWCDTSDGHLYLMGNVSADRTDPESGDEWDITNDSSCNEAANRENSSQVRSTTYPITISTAAAAYTAILASTGAGAIIPSRDSVDADIITETTNGTGDCLNDSGDLPSYPSLSAGSAWTDTDSDGMPDSWETSEFGDLDQDETTDFDSDGYYDLEEWVNSFYTESGDSAPPVITIDNSDPTYITTDSLTITGNGTDADGTINTCKCRIGNEPGDATGTTCTADSAPYDSASEDWTCSSFSGFSQGANTLYCECEDDSDNWSVDNYITVNFDSVAPTTSTREIQENGTHLYITFSETVTVNNSSGFSITGAEGGVGISSCDTNSAPMDCTLTGTIYSGDTDILLHYSGAPANAIEDLAGNDVADFSNGAVTNNSIQSQTVVSTGTGSSGSVSMN